MLGLGESAWDTDLLDQLEIPLLGVFLTGPLERFPGIPLGFTDKVQKS